MFSQQRLLTSSTALFWFFINQNSDNSVFLLGEEAFLLYNKSLLYK